MPGAQVDRPKQHSFGIPAGDEYFGLLAAQRPAPAAAQGTAAGLFHLQRAGRPRAVIALVSGQSPLFLRQVWLFLRINIAWTLTAQANLLHPAAQSAWADVAAVTLGQAFGQ